MVAKNTIDASESSLEKWVRKISKLDRRIIFVFILLAVLLPYLIKFDLPVRPAPIVKSMYDKIEAVGDKKGTILLSMDFDPSAQAELVPMSRAILSHAFSRGIKVVGMTQWYTGVTLTEQTLAAVAKEYNKEYGKDWAYLGYKAGVGILILSMGQDLPATFPKDTRGNSLKSLEATRNILTLRDFDYVIDIVTGYPGVDQWVQYGQSKFGFTLGVAATGVMAPDYFPYLQAKQINSLVGGLVGAAQYEALINKPAAASFGMRPQSIAHLVLIFFILFGNACYFMNRHFERRRKAS